MHNNNIHYPRRIGSRVSFSAQKTKVKQCVVLRQQRVLVLWLVALVMAFRNVQNLLLINHNNGFIDDDDEFVALYNLYASKNLNFPYNSYVPFNLKRLMSLRVLLWTMRYTNSEGVLQIPDTTTCSQRSVCDGLEGLCMLLKRLSYPCRDGDMIHKFDKPVPVLSLP